MFQLIWSCISGFWDLLCQSMSPTNTSPSSDSDAMPCTTTSQAPSTSASIAMPSTTHSTFVSSSTPTQYDVFLSFRGLDTRLNFTGHLYDKLESNGIRTFRDDPELRRGEVISDALLDAIRNSKSYIIVFSENYASSSWCLDELVEILNCHKAAERVVIPVFYKVEPSIVRYQIESFRQAFEKHQLRFGMEKVNKWRLALKQVASLSGSHICENTPEADVINEIVHELLLKINPKTLDVTKYPVGLDSRVNAITALLSSDTEGVTKLGIYGMGGVGKTTLAKALFNQLVRGGRFKGSCFLANVRENSGTTKGLVSLQMQLINDVLSSTKKVEVHNVDQGIEFIEARICSTKIVVVIDDLDDLKQFQSLMGPFSSESVVIITTRDEEILIKTEVEPRYRYMVNMLDDADSLALFTRHAFGNDEPNNALLGLSKDILCLAGGLPLALEVFGSYLYKRSEEGWKYYIEKLHRNPNSSIQQRLAISLDALELDDPDLKKIFLDIACCFNGWEKQYVVQIIESYYSHADQHIDMLQKRCLLTIDSADELGMHDLLQDMGREIAHNNSRDEPGKHSRLWVTGDIHDVLRNHKGTEAIECIIFRKKEFPHGDIAYNMETFERMSKLRFLYLNKVNLTGSFEHSLDDLKWLCWDQCPLECLPLEFYPQKLVVLELPSSNIRAMWELNMVPHVFEKLKTLDMSYSRYLYTTPDFTVLPSLETLNLKGCKSLEEVNVSIGSLVRLVSLDLRYCTKLRSLPDTICNLRALQLLYISECKSLEALPIQRGNINSLIALIAKGLTVSKLPDSIGHLSKLDVLDLSHNKKLKTLPDTICNLRSLDNLIINGCEELEILPDELWKITSLTWIDASFTTLLRKLPDIGSSQTSLSLQAFELFMTGITALPSDFSRLANLQYLDLDYCEYLLSIPTLPPNLKRIKAFRCESLERIANLSNLKQLEKLDLSYCKGLTYIKGLEELTCIRTLNLTGCSGLTYIQGLAGLASLRKLQLGDSLVAYKHLTKGLFQGTEAIHGIIPRKLEVQKDALDGQSFATETFKRMSTLKFLYLKKVNFTGSFEQAFKELRWFCWDCCPLKSLPSDFYPQELVALELPHSNMRTIWEPSMVSHVFGKLKILNMSYSHDLITTPDFVKLPCLVTLNLGYCESLKEVHASIRSLVWLVLLNLRGCVKLKSLPDSIGNLRSLEILDIDNCSSLEALPMAIGNIESLKKIDLRRLTVLKLPDSIGRLSKLVELDLSNNKKLETLPDTICNLRSLEALNICGCEKLGILPDMLWNITKLRKLDATSATLLKKLPDIGSNQIALSLQELILSCSGITALPSGFSQLSNLQSLNLNSCDNLFYIPKLPPNLKRLYASGCFSLERLPNLSNLKQLEELNLSYCSGLTEIHGLEELSSLKKLLLEGGWHMFLLAYKHLTQRLCLGTETIKSIIPRNVYPQKDALEGESFTSEAFKKI